MERPDDSGAESFRAVQTEMLEKSWGAVAEALKAATYELVQDLSDADKEALETHFWHAHPLILKREETSSPGITERILDRADVYMQELREHENEVFEKVTLPRVKRNAFIRGFFGLPLS